MQRPAAPAAAAALLILQLRLQLCHLPPRLLGASPPEAALLLIYCDLQQASNSSCKQYHCAEHTLRRQVARRALACGWVWCHQHNSNPRHPICSTTTPPHHSTQKKTSTKSLYLEQVQLLRLQVALGFQAERAQVRPHCQLGPIGATAAGRAQLQ